jgi:hypothetical protein
VSRGCLAAVVPLPLCGHCRHLWPAHWSAAEGCQAPTGPDSVCGCPQTPPDGDPDRPDNPDDTPDEREEDQAA